MHPILERQLQALGLSASLPPQATSWHHFLDVVDSVYEKIDNPAAASTDLDEHERMMSAVFEVAHEGILITDADTRILQANPAARALSGYSLDALAGHRATSLFRGARTRLREIRRDLAAHRTWQGELQIANRDGLATSFWTTVDMVHDRGGGQRHYIIMFSDISPLKRTEAELQFAASHDPMTGLPNRIQFQNNLAAAIDRGRRDGRKFGLLFMDLDRFKSVNDNLGHPVGDRLLCELGKRLQGILRGQDEVCRMGGDEFTVITAPVDRVEDLAVVAEKVLEAFDEPFLTEDLRLQVTASMGISVFPDDGRDSDALIHRADIAMYAAKASPRSGYRFFNAEMSDRAFHYLSTETGLRRALERQEFFLVYQPQYNVDTGRVAGVEALLRWRDPDRGDLRPGEFLEIAEVTGLIEPIGRWVIDEVFERAMRWHRLGIPRLPLAINLSYRQLNHPGIVADISDRLHHHGLPAGWVTFEVTETTIFHHGEKALSNLRQIAQEGFPFALDNFGDGLSSLNRIRQLPLYRLKVARGLIQGIGDSGNEAVIRTILALGRNMNIDVVAEGVETRAQKDFLVTEGCREMQGFHFCHPLEQHQIEAFLADHFSSVD